MAVPILSTTTTKSGEESSMKKFEMEVKIQRKAQFEEMVEKILSFLRKNFEEDERIWFMNVPYIFTTKDRNKVIQLISGLKNLDFQNMKNKFWKLLVVIGKKLLQLNLIALKKLMG
jgi:hypothetical protein